eukprot:TRINITY_DN17280_c0_g1_i2.p2 TRINITY_DN17280_c0_g1~~TRINITY_DN17280_c0_g1_i2.p2  ORF type:complete len:343 (+),score=86.82 TRINITY_DN17280_c0_g1_i2:114-1142(+)
MRTIPRGEGVCQSLFEDRDAARVFVGGLPGDFADNELRALIEQVQFNLPAHMCDLLECRVLNGKGCGYVRFSSWEAAEEAINNLNDRAVTGWASPLRVRWATPKAGGGGGGGAPAHGQLVMPGAKSGVAEDRDAARLFIAGLPSDCTESELRALVEQVYFARLSPSMTQVVECRVISGKGVGYVKFSSWEAAEAAIKQLHDRAVTGWSQALRVEWAVPKGAARGSGGPPASAAVQALQDWLATTQIMPPREDEASVQRRGEDSKRLFVGQILREMKEDAALETLFEPFGQVENIKFLYDKGVAYVQFRDFEAAGSAVATLDGQRIPAMSLPTGLKCVFSKLR